MAVNVGEAVAHLTLDTSEFKKALNGAGKDLEIFVHKVEKEKTRIEKLQEALAKEAGTLSKIGKSMEKPSVAAQNLLKTGMKNTLAEEAKSKNPKKGPANIAKNNYDKIQKDIQASIKKVQDSFGQLQASVVKQLIPIFNDKLVPILNNKLIPAFTKIANKAIELMNSFNKLPNPVKNAIAIMIVSIAGIAKTFTVLSKLVGTINNVIGIFGKLKKAGGIFGLLKTIITSKTLLILVAIAAIGLIVYEVIKHWDKLKAYFIKFWNGTKKVFHNFWSWLQEFFKKWGPIILAILAPFLGIPLLIIQNWDRIKSAFSAILVHITNVGKKIGKFFEESAQGWKMLGEDIVGYVKKLGHRIIDGFVNGIEKRVKRVKDAATNLANTVKSGFKNPLKIHSPSRVFDEYGRFIGEGLIHGIDNQESAINNKFKGIANKIKGLGNVRPNFNGLNNMSLSGAYGGTYASPYGPNNMNKSMGLTQDIKMYVTIPNADKEGANKIANEFKQMTESSMKNVMTGLFMNDVLRD
ncbi:hypothetical protein FDC22_10510 [Clostridium botulinum]|nr:hypothetical protein [Clostridium botulinum]MBD5562317.1 hypothetical protein [Clostridium botulinum]MBD5567748.1 hypothetical protein [Clostridium botulinum]MBD5571751.1 hypothetical protein [Clostridium botulinum]MBD5574379.1 hypothetical protein [Clostridium botulinum]MBD5578902.1 hypothetical protein [Clostridium botulinum]